MRRRPIHLLNGKSLAKIIRYHGITQELMNNYAANSDLVKARERSRQRERQHRRALILLGFGAAVMILVAFAVLFFQELLSK